MSSTITLSYRAIELILFKLGDALEDIEDTRPEEYDEEEYAEMQEEAIELRAVIASIHGELTRGKSDSE